MFQLLLAIIYLAFISLGLPDSLLGSAWPIMQGELNVPVSYAGVISMIIAIGTIISSLQSDRLTKKLGTGKVTAISVGMTMIALFGFSSSTSFWMLCIWAIPYGLGAGSVDASLNNYVALHYSSRHMSWLHCMWGVGASAGPYIMGYALSGGKGWSTGYLVVGVMQIVLTLILLVSLPLWKEKNLIPHEEEETQDDQRVLSLLEIIKIPGAKEVMLTFFCYCAIEQTAGLWGSSFLVQKFGIEPTKAATYASMFFIGITIGRAISGFLTAIFNDNNMIRLGEGIIVFGICFLFSGANKMLGPIGLIIVGLGCAPIYPSVIHATPSHFGKKNSQAVIGVQMASAYVGTCVMPPIFGQVANHISIKLFPWYIMVILISMIIMHELLIRKTNTYKEE